MLPAFISLSLSATALASPDTTAIATDRPPPARFYSVVHDVRRGRVVLFGGRDSSGASNQVWTLEQVATGWRWAKLDPAGSPPAPRSQHAALYDPDSDRMLVFGGIGADGPLADLWALSFGDDGRWEQIVPEGVAPEPRYSPSMVLDPRRNRALILGGGHREVWELSLGSPPRWSRYQVRGEGPGVRFGQTAVLDSIRDRILVYGGFGGNYSPLMRATGQSPTRTHSDVWELTLGDSAGWTRLEPKGMVPPDRGYHAAGVDPSRDYMLILGGGTRYRGDQKDLWAFSMAGPPRWEGRGAGTGFESAGQGTGLIVDGRRGRLLLFGGLDTPGGVQEVPLAPIKFEMPKPPSPWVPILVFEGFFAAYSCIGYIGDGEWLAGLNGLTGAFATGSAIFFPGRDVTREAQLTLGLGWLGLGIFQADQSDRDVPNNEIVLGNLIGMNALVLVTGGVEWVASKLHGPRH